MCNQQECKPRTPHKHAELIKAWADGAQIQFFAGNDTWRDISNPGWDTGTRYRVKPPENRVITGRIYAYDQNSKISVYVSEEKLHNIRATFSPDGKLLSIEKIGD